ncbi:MAG TPA: single-stranded DNA-binding protein [Solirubrobacterales bacterium]|nr:single-stranded DNA-binding protein [Solirubrobacterales bacterium]
MNSVNLVGRLTKDPELSERGETKVCDLRIAVNGQGDLPAVFIDVAAFKGQADACATYLSKGSQIAVSGSLRYSQWEKDGSKRSKHSVLAREVRFLDPKPEGEEKAE